MALNVPPAMTQAPTQGQQAQGNAAVSTNLHPHSRIAKHFGYMSAAALLSPLVITAVAGCRTGEHGKRVAYASTHLPILPPSLLIVSVFFRFQPALSAA